MNSKRFIGVGDTIIMNPNNITSSIIAPSENSVRSIKSIRTNSTHETPRQDNFKALLNESLNFKTFRRKVPTDLKYLSLNNNSKRQYKCYLRKYPRTELNKEPMDLISDADKIMKEREKNFILPNQLVKSYFIKNTNEIRLNNYKIKLMSKKRTELNTSLYEMSRTIKVNEKTFDQDYKRFLKFVDDTNQSYKKQEKFLNKCKTIKEQKDTKFNDLILENKKLKDDIEYMVRRILTLRYYGSFIHKAFKIDFPYEGVKRIEGQSYLALAEDIMKIYGKNKENANKIKLLDEDWLMAQIKELESNILNIIKEKELINKENIKMELAYKEEIARLNEQIKDLEKRLELAKEDKNLFIKTISMYDNPENIDTVLDCLAELTESLELKSAPISILLKDKTPMSYVTICSNLIKKVKEKENILINNIQNIENIIKGENKEDKLLIEEIIDEKRKETKKRKIFQLQKEQKEKEMKKKMKAFERLNRIVIK